MLPQGTPGILETEMRLKSNYFCYITFRTNRPSLQTCIRHMSVRKHFFSHHATPPQKVKLLFMIQCSKTCQLPESRNLEPKFRDTSSTGTPHMWEKPSSVTIVMLAQVTEAWTAMWKTRYVLLKLRAVTMQIDPCLNKGYTHSLLHSESSTTPFKCSSRSYWFYFKGTANHLRANCLCFTCWSGLNSISN